MRLIDADKLFTWLVSSWRNKYPIGDGSQFDIVHIYEIKEEIDNAETVDAIPIKWIEQYIGKEIKRYGCKIPETNSIQNMLNDWRKENESNISD
jgi:hypothetical protein